jgi:excisionase family DNA binding protein
VITLAPRVIITTAEAARRLGVSRERGLAATRERNSGCLPHRGTCLSSLCRSRGEGFEHDRLLLSIQEAARRAGVSSSTIRRSIETGLLEGFRLEGDRRVYVALD